MTRRWLWLARKRAALDAADAVLHLMAPNEEIGEARTSASHGQSAEADDAD